MLQNKRYNFKFKNKFFDNFIVKQYKFIGSFKRSSLINVFYNIDSCNAMGAIHFSNLFPFDL